MELCEEQNMEKNKQTEKTGLFSYRRWQLYTEIIAVIGFLVLAVVYTQRGGAELDTPNITQADNLIVEADAFYDKQDLASAGYLYWQALHALETEKTNENKSDRLHVNLRIAEIYSRSNWLIDAKSRLQYAAQIQPNHKDVLLLSGKFYRDEHSPEKATEKFLAVLDKNPNDPEANYLLGIMYQGNKQYEEAAERYKIAIENDPKLKLVPSEKAPFGILARLQLSRTYNKLFQSYLLLDRKLTDEEYEEITRLENQAIILLEEAIKLEHSTPEIVDDLIRLYYVRANALKREAATRPYADALEVYERIVELDPSEITAWQDMGDIYDGFLDDNENALKMYKKVYELEPHATTLAIIKSLEAEIAEEIDK